MLRSRRSAFILLLIIAVFMSACQPASPTPTVTPRPPTTVPTEAAATAEATTEAAATMEATMEAAATTEAEATAEMTLEGVMPTVDVMAPTEEATTEMGTAEATPEETAQVVLPPTEEMTMEAGDMTAEPTSEMATMEATAEATAEMTMEASAETRNIIEVATADGNFTTLLAALDKAGLTETLEGAGPFTVFAPSDTAFEAFFASTGMTADDLLNNPDLANILLYHVVSGSVTADQLEEYRSSDNPDVIVVPTLDGDNTLAITFGADVPFIINDTATITLQNVEASNGVIHVIDDVLLPPAEEAMPETTAEATLEITLEPVAAPTEEATIEVVMLPTMTPDASVTAEAPMEATSEMTPEATIETRSIIEVATADGNFKTLLAALDKAGLTDELEGEGPFTVFAPTDEAFEKLLEASDMTAEELLDNPDLAKILMYHVVSGLYPRELLDAASSDEVENTFIIPTLDEGLPLSVNIDEDGTLIINQTVKVTMTNVETSNGIIHVIDTVLMPPADLEGTPEATAEATAES